MPCPIRIFWAVNPVDRLRDIVTNKEGIEVGAYAWLITCRARGAQRRGRRGVVSIGAEEGVSVVARRGYPEVIGAAER